MPFDRHDWIVDRGDGREVRYVIDFYKGTDRMRALPPPAGAPVGTPPEIIAVPTMYLDVRPALDSFGALTDRVIRFIKDEF